MEIMPLCPFLKIENFLSMKKKIESIFQESIVLWNNAVLFCTKLKNPPSTKIFSIFSWLWECYLQCKNQEMNEMKWNETNNGEFNKEKKNKILIMIHRVVSSRKLVQDFLNLKMCD